MSHPLQEVKARLDPVKDKSFIDRIAHAKVCQNWSIIENVCLGHKDVEEWCENCQCYADKDIVLTKGLCESCQDPKTCENGNDGDRCEGCARHLYELSNDL